MSRRTHVPMRMCMGCGARAPQSVFVRVAAGPGATLRAIQDHKHQGRSGYLHRDKECLDRFASRKGPLRSLGCSVDKLVRAAFIAELQRIEPSAIVR